MGTRRLTYIIALSLSLAFHALYPFWFSWYLMVVVLLLIPFDLLFSIPGMLTKRLTLGAPRILERDAEGTLIITTYQQKPFPAGSIISRLAITGEDFAYKHKMICSPEGGSRRTIDIDTTHSGLTVFSLNRIRTTGIIGLFSLPRKVNQRVMSLILPPPIKPPRFVSLPRVVALRPKPGGGFSEDSDLRPYRKGDPIRSIHWKLSAKHDSLIVREPLEPLPYSRLVQLTKWTDARERDLILGRFRWATDFLHEKGLPFFVKHGENGAIAEIKNNEDFIAYLFSILASELSTQNSRAPHLLTPAPYPMSPHTPSPVPCPLSPIPSSVPTRFSWVLQIDAKEVAPG